MELTTTLHGQAVQTVVRTIGINPNYWYPVGWARELEPEQVRSVTVWKRAIAIYCDAQGHLFALENACPHRGVELHLGMVQGQRLTICNENAMDVFHGELHKDLQGWFDPVLLNLNATDTSVRAEYPVSYQGRLAPSLGLSDRPDEATTLPVTIQYLYPRYRSTLPGVSSVYLMRLPVDAAESRSFALFFFRVNLPRWLIQAIRPWLSWIIQRFMRQRFLDQDIEMIESEQANCLANPGRRYVEINPAILALQRLMVRQYEQFMQQSSQLSGSPVYQADQAFRTDALV